MNIKQSFLKMFVIVTVLALSGASLSLAADKTYVMTGKISAIDEMYDTVVIEVPLGSKMI